MRIQLLTAATWLCLTGNAVAFDYCADPLVHTKHGGNQSACASEWEIRALETNRGTLRKLEKSILIRLNEGQWKRVANPSGLFQILAMDRSCGVVFLREQYSEGNAWHAVSLHHGSVTEIGGHPSKSPSGLRFVTSENAEAYNIWTLRVYRCEVDGPIAEFFRQDMAWAPERVRSRNDSQIEFDQVFWKNGVPTRRPRLLTSRDNAWEIIDRTR